MAQNTVSRQSTHTSTVKILSPVESRNSCFTSDLSLARGISTFVSGRVSLKVPGGSEESGGGTLMSRSFALVLILYSSPFPVKGCGHTSLIGIARLQRPEETGAI